MSWAKVGFASGLAIAEVASAEAIYEAIAAWAAYLEFRVRPILGSEQAVPISDAAIAWRDSIG